MAVGQVGGHRSFERALEERGQHPAERAQPGAAARALVVRALEHGGSDTVTVVVADAPRGANAPEGMRWAPEASLDGEAFPTVFRKALALARDE